MNKIDDILRSLDIRGLDFAEADAVYRTARRFLEEGTNPARELGALYCHAVNDPLSETNLKGNGNFFGYWVINDVLFSNGQYIENGQPFLKVWHEHKARGWSNGEVSKTAHESAESFARGRIFHTYIAVGRQVSKPSGSLCALLETEGDPFEQVDWTRLSSWPLESLKALRRALRLQSWTLREIKDLVDVRGRIEKNNTHCARLDALLRSFAENS